MCKNKNELRSAISKYRKLKAEESALKKELAATQAEIMDYLTYHDIQPQEKVMGPNFTVSFSICSSSSVDRQALKAVLGDDLSPFLKTSEYVRLNVK